MTVLNLYSLFWTVFFCLGLNTVSREGYLLHFIRKPFEDNYNRVEALKQMSKPVGFWREVFAVFGKPFILCITCMASIWGAAIYLLIVPEHKVFELILNCVSASFIQTVIWKYANMD